MHGTDAARGTAALEEALTVPAAAEKLRVSERHLWTLISTGAMPSFKIAGKRKVLARDLDAYVDQLRESAAEPDGERPPSGPSTPKPPAGPRGGETP